MKLFSRILYFAAAAVITAVGAAYLVLEGRMLLSGDWLLHEQQAVAFTQFFIRFVFAGLAFVTGIRAMTGHLCLTAGGCLAAAAAGLCLFASNRMGLYLLIASAVFLTAGLLKRKYTE